MHIKTKRILGNGFTLIELLVVVLIIGILAAVALPQYQKAVDKTSAMQAVSVMKSIVNAQNLYKLATGAFATDINDLDVTIPGEMSTYGAPSVKTAHFEFVMHFPSSSLAHLQANNANKGYYIIYYWTLNRLKCMASKTNERGNKICKNFNPVSVTCPESGYNCYDI
jgi:type II secretion system protein G